jgi:hypothetical protein
VININIKNLYEGMIIKNYKELCKILEVKEQTGCSKIKQLEELAIYCKYNKEGNKFMIEQIYKNPTITLKDLTKNKNSKYIKILSNIVVEHLYNNPKELQEIPLLKLFSILGITNSNYASGSRYRKELSQLFNAHLASVYYFYSNTRNEYKSIIERCLNNLRNRRVLNWNRCIMIIDKENERVYKADRETEKEIINMEKQALEHLKINNMYELMQDKSKLKEFNNILKKEMGFEYYYAYDLIIGDIALKIEYDNIQAEKTKINKLILDRTKNIFDKDRYINFSNDYKILMDLLISTEESNEYTQILIDKHKENIINYKEERIRLNTKYNQDNKELINKYLDKYDIE